MERSNGRELEAMSGAPVKKMPARPSVSSPSVPIPDPRGQEVNVVSVTSGLGSGNQLRGSKPTSQLDCNAMNPRASQRH
jgi:hypothetical protein